MPEAHPSASREHQAFSRIAPYYDALMRDIPYRRWRDYVAALVQLAGRQQILSERLPVLDLACGTGTLTLEYARDGHRVVGVDISPDMIAVARQKAAARQLPAEFRVGDAAELSEEPGAFGLCISLFDSLNYVTDPARLQESFRRVRKVLMDGGLFIFDLNTSVALERRMFDQEDLTPGESVRYRWRSTYDPATRLCRVNMEFWVRNADGTEDSFVEVHWQRAYSDDEVRHMLSAAGFVRVTGYEAYRLKPPGPQSDRIFYVAEVGRA